MAHDLVKHGLIPELVGRIPLIVALDDLDEESFVRILKEPKNSLYKQYSKLFELDGVKLEITPEAFSEIARLAKERKTSARGLRAIIEEFMMEYMYSIPDDASVEKLIITAEAVNRSGKALIKKKKPAVKSTASSKKTSATKTTKKKTAE